MKCSTQNYLNYLNSAYFWTGYGSLFNHTRHTRIKSHIHIISKYRNIFLQSSLASDTLIYQKGKNTVTADPKCTIIQVSFFYSTCLIRLSLIPRYISSLKI